jgi:hypothetical protein
MRDIYSIKLKTYEMSVSSGVRLRVGVVDEYILLRGTANGFTPGDICSQSRQMERRLTPNTRVESEGLGFVRQVTEQPVLSRGKIYSGKITHIKILKPYQTGSHKSTAIHKSGH